MCPPGVSGSSWNQNCWSSVFVFSLTSHQLHVYSYLDSVLSAAICVSAKPVEVFSAFCGLSSHFLNGIQESWKIYTKPCGCMSYITFMSYPAEDSKKRVLQFSLTFTKWSINHVSKIHHYFIRNSVKLILILQLLQLAASSKYEAFDKTQNSLN